MLHKLVVLGSDENDDKLKLNLKMIKIIGILSFVNSQD